MTSGPTLTKCIKASHLGGPQNLKKKTYTYETKSVTKCHFFVGKSLEDINFIVNYALSISKYLFICR